MKTSVILMLLLLLLACNEIQTSEALLLPNFYPFGQSEGDLLMPQNDDGSSGTVSIPIPFPFFGQNHNSLFVNTNGIISFLVHFSQYNPNAFPLGDNRRLVAPFWADVNTVVAGEVFYRGTTDATLLQQATNDVTATFVDHRNFRATWLLIATWYKVAFHLAKGSSISKRNTFQAVLITNGRHSFVIFNYNKITWTTGTASLGNSSGLGGTPAQAGFNAGDGTRYFNIPGSGTHQVINLPNKSNVENPGRWMFRIDSAIIQAFVCNTKDGSWTKLSPAPGCLPANFYPFGQSEGDLLMPKNDDGSSGTVPIPIPFPYFYQNHNSLFVNTNGVISFLVQVSQYTPDAFPLGDNRRLVAPFWADVDTSVAGEVFYRETTDATLLQQATNDVTATFVDHRNFRATWLLVATWYKVAFFGAAGSYTSKRNTFQAVLITNGRHSFVIFNYNKITWTSGTASSGNSSGLGGTPAQAGFNAGDGRRYFNIPGSRTRQVIDLPGKSNVKNPGRWMFRIDSGTIQ